MSLQINILDKVEYYPVLVDNKYEARIYPSTLKIIWEDHLFSNIDAEKTALEIKDIEEIILKQFKLIK
jgi:hypothetical protein